FSRTIRNTCLIGGGAATAAAGAAPTAPRHASVARIVPIFRTARNRREHPSSGQSTTNTPLTSLGCDRIGCRVPPTLESRLEETDMATADRTRIAKASPVVEDDQGQLRARTGISREVVEEMSKIKGEPNWLREKRLKSYEIFERKPVPKWGVDLSALDFDDLVLYSPPTAGRYDSWDEVPEEMKRTYDDLGIPQAEREHLAGVVGVWDNEPVYEGLKQQYKDLGILFCSTDTAVQEYPELVEQYFMTKCVPPQDNKFSALHGAIWSGG